MEIIYDIMSTAELSAIVVFSGAFLISFKVIPKVISLVNYKDLMDNPNDRSSHERKTPTLGGVAFYVSLVICLLFLKPYDTTGLSVNLIAGLTILFVVGLKDDLMVLSAKSKFLSQILAVFLVIIMPEFQGINFFGFCEVGVLPSLVSLPFSCFIVLSTINGYNLIDGIDGLASMVGIIIFLTFSFLFYNTTDYYYFLIGIIGIAFLLGFLYYNLSDRNKIFMGDTGSMIVGFIIGILVLKLFNLSVSKLQIAGINPKNTFLLSVAILLVPFLDVARVFIIRLMNKKEPFSPDRNHIHHVLVDLGWSHIKSSVVISLVNLGVILIIYFLNFYFSYLWLSATLVAILLFFIFLLFKLNKNFSAKRKKVLFKEKLKMNKKSQKLK